MARPTKLTDNIVDLAAEYVETVWIEKRRAVPTLQGMALHTGIPSETLRDWQRYHPTEPNQNETLEEFGKRCQRHVKFSRIVMKLDDLQADNLVDGALKNKLNAKTANMMLSRHGYVERREVDQTVKGDVQFVNDVPRGNGA